MRLVTFAVIALVLTGARQAEALTDQAQALEVGHWLSIRGRTGSHGEFLAERVELIDPQRYEELIGTALEDPTSPARFTILGHVVESNIDTRLDDLSRTDLIGRRIRVEGYYYLSAPFVAREISSRDPGRERLVGRVHEITLTEESTAVTVMGYTVRISTDTAIEVERPIAQYMRDTAPPRVEPSSVDEDDLFGTGFAITPNLHLQGNISATKTAEDNFNLEEDDAEDRVDTNSSLRARLLWTPSNNFHAIADLRYSKRWREDEEDGRSSRSASSLGEALLHWNNLGNRGVELTVGRQDFDDQREWIYDQNMDGVKLAFNQRRFRAELSLTTTLSDGDRRDEAATNFIAYLSNNSDNRHLAAYLVRRDIDAIDGDQSEVPTHYGFRALGDWLPHAESWLELATLRGSRAGRDIEAWGLDVGTTWELGSRTYFTLSYAHGSGGEIDETVDQTFRQTGLQDNNSKFGGVTSFRYYGELAEPELANLSIYTVGLGWRLASRTSLDLVWHQYLQDQARSTLIDSEIDQRPNGIDKDLGWELDLVFGVRRDDSWHLELVGAYYQPGIAFDDRDSAFLLKAQFRYRY